MDERKIDFVLISSTRKPRGEGKTERERAKKGGQRTLRDGNGNGRKRRGGKAPANFEPDSAFRKDDAKPAGKVKKTRRPKRRKHRPKPKDCRGHQGQACRQDERCGAGLTCRTVIITGRPTSAARLKEHHERNYLRYPRR